MICDIERLIEENRGREAQFAEALAKAWIIHGQALNRKASPKIYSWHAAEVECIGKAKAKAPNEFGCKAMITTTNGCASGGMFVLHADALHGNPYDGHTLGDVLSQTANLTGVTPNWVFDDKGYGGHKQNQIRFDPETRQDIPAQWRGFMVGQKALKPHLKAELKRRPAIELVIGHLKSDHRMGRNHPKRKTGDRFNVKMAATGFNFRRVLAWLKGFLREIFAAITVLYIGPQWPEWTTCWPPPPRYPKRPQMAAS